MNIRFGTSGWRAIIADDFTFENVRLVTEAICRYLKNNSDKTQQTVIVGHDSRFMGETFCQVAAEIAKQKGFRVLLCQNPTPTPTISYAIRKEKAAGGINFTASHNPPEYQGIKFSTADGAPALPEITKQIEEFVRNPQKIADEDGGSIEKYDACPAYLEDLKTKIRFDVIANAKGKYAYDPLWGTGRGYLNKILQDLDLEVETIHDWRDVMFGGQAPEPGAEHVGELRETVKSKGLTLGLATDGDGDRFGVIDSNGDFIEPNHLIAILTDYLFESRGWTLGVARSVATSHLIDRVAANRGLKLYETPVGFKFIEPNHLIAILTDYLFESRGWTLGVARSVATSHLIDRVAANRGLKLYETPVGFKFIGELINKDEIILGGEESAGLSIRGHYPEKDGILACLLAAEAVAARGKSLTEQLNELYERVGKLYSGRIGVKLTPEVAEKLKEKLAQEPTEISGRKIEKVNRMDGVKFIFADESWMLLRPSGTEPLVRIYAEAETKEDLEVLIEQGRHYLLG